MKIINENTDEFTERFSNRVMSTNNITRRTGTPLFTRDQITEHPDILVKLLRLILVDNNVSVEEFTVKFRTYALETLRMHPTKINTQKRNLLVAMRKSRITWKRFVEIVSYVLGFNITDLHIALVTDKGKDKKYTLSDTIIDKKESKSG